MASRTMTVDEDYHSAVTPIASIVAVVVTVITFLVIAFSGYFTIDQGERGVITHYGAVSGVAGPGFHFKMPFVTGVTKVDMQVQKIGFNKQAEGDYRMSAYSRDQQPATVALAINYHITDPVKLYTEFGTSENFESRVVDSKAQEIFKNVFGQFDAADAIQQRAKLNAAVTSALGATVDHLGIGMIDSVQIEDISFSSQYEAAVESRMQAIVKQQQAEADKAKRMIDADAAKYEREARADADKYAGLAEATAIQAKNDALKSSPDIVAYTAAQRWDGKLPETMVPGGALPFLNVK